MTPEKRYHQMPEPLPHNMNLATADATAIRELVDSANRMLRSRWHGCHAYASVMHTVARAHQQLGHRTRLRALLNTPAALDLLESLQAIEARCPHIPRAEIGAEYSAKGDVIAFFGVPIDVRPELDIGCRPDQRVALMVPVADGVESRLKVIARQIEWYLPVVFFLPDGACYSITLNSYDTMRLHLPESNCKCPQCDPLYFLATLLAQLQEAQARTPGTRIRLLCSPIFEQGLREALWAASAVDRSTYSSFAVRTYHGPDHLLQAFYDFRVDIRPDLMSLGAATMCVPDNLSEAEIQRRTKIAVINTTTQKVAAEVRKANPDAAVEVLPTMEINRRKGIIRPVTEKPSGPVTQHGVSMN